MEGVEGSPLDADLIWKTVERAATDATSVHHVVENTDETPDDDETVMDWLRTIDPDALETVVNNLLAEHATTILDRGVVCERVEPLFRLGTVPDSFRCRLAIQYRPSPVFWRGAEVAPITPRR